MIDNRKKLIREIEAHLRRCGMSRTEFCYRATGDAGFLTKIEKGRIPRTAMVRRVEEFISEHQEGLRR